MATFILIHGACQGGWCWEKVVPLLEARGHKALAPDLPGSGDDHLTPPAAISLPLYVDFLSKMLDKEIEPVILVGHSVGGLTITHAAEARRRKIRALVYLTGTLPPPGKTNRDITGSDPDSMIRRAYEGGSDGLTYTFKRSIIPTLFFNDCDPADVYRAMSRMRPQATAIVTTPMTYTEERFGGVPRWYIECLRSNAITLEMQRMVNGSMPFNILQLDSGHSPNYSMPEALVEHLETIAQKTA